MPDRDNRQKGRPPRGVDDMGGVVPRVRGMKGGSCLGAGAGERFGLDLASKSVLFATVTERPVRGLNLDCKRG